MAEAASPSRRQGGQAPALAVSNLSRYFDVSPPFLNRLFEGSPRQILKAVDGVSFRIEKGDTFSLVGESGCGKSTVARVVVGLYAPTDGTIAFEGIDVASLRSRAQMAPLRRRMQMIFQDPFASLNPRWRAADIIAEPIRVFKLVEGKAAIQHRVGELLKHVGMSPVDAQKYLWVPNIRSARRNDVVRPGRRRDGSSGPCPRRAGRPALHRLHLPGPHLETCTSGH